VGSGTDRLLALGLVVVCGLMNRCLWSCDAKCCITKASRMTLFFFIVRFLQILVIFGRVCFISSSLGPSPPPIWGWFPFWRMVFFWILIILQL
jgi:hypothetical protein